MKLSCTQENLNHGLSLVGHLAIKNSNLPILNNILIKTQEGGLLLSATNLEIGVNCKIRAKIEDNGIFTIPANLLTNFINLLNTEEKVDIELINKELIIKSGQQKTKIKGEDATEFPLIPEIKKENKNIVKSEDLKKALSQVVFAASLDETRVEISGILMNFKGKELVLAATDSYRLAEKQVNFKEKNFNQQFIIPQRTAQELLRILQLLPIEEDVVIYVNDNQVLFEINQVELISRLIEGNYPDYQQIIPKEYKTTISVNIKDFTRVIKRAALFSKIGINDVDLLFDTEKQLIVVKSANNQLGENVSEQEAVIKGEGNNIVFNYRYLLDGLSNIDAERVEIKIINNSNPGLFQGKEVDDYLYIIMPIRQ
jgi:DNA polymerase-3 subunit beta